MSCDITHCKSYLDVKWDWDVNEIWSLTHCDSSLLVSCDWNISLSLVKVSEMSWGFKCKTSSYSCDCNIYEMRDTVTTSCDINETRDDKQSLQLVYWNMNELWDTLNDTHVKWWEVTKILMRYDNELQFNWLLRCYQNKWDLMASSYSWDSSLLPLWGCELWVKYEWDVRLIIVSIELVRCNWDGMRYLCDVEILLRNKTWENSMQSLWGGKMWSR